MKRTRIASLLASETPIEDVCLMGWIRTRRDAKGFSFIELNDGSCLKNIQVIAAGDLPEYEQVLECGTGSAIKVTGNLAESPAKGQRWEVHAKSIVVLGQAPETYPLQKKRHTDEFLRTIAHLRPRTNKYGAMFRIRSEVALAIHRFFQDRGFRYVHTPIITGSDCEGAGEMFRVATPKAQGQGADMQPEFFGQEAYLTVSGQLSAEMLALALGDVYSFGPTFRAENSNTRRHAAEFWMIEPEMAFADLSDNMELGESLITHLVCHVLDRCAEDIGLFAQYVEKELMKQLERIVSAPFTQITYTEAIDLLQRSGRSFDYAPSWGIDLQTEHERFLTETHFGGPVIVTGYPKDIKPFYMRVNDDGKTVAAMDILVPGIGEIVGGSQREERLDVLEGRMRALGMNMDAYWWYLDSRRFGSVPHCGFGMGFERVLMMLTGVSNIRDVIPFPRTPGSIAF
jgi:asparaginyl-tRNA synthetase